MTKEEKAEYVKPRHSDKYVDYLIIITSKKIRDEMFGVVFMSTLVSALIAGVVTAARNALEGVYVFPVLVVTVYFLLSHVFGKTVQRESTLSDRVRRSELSD